MIKHLFIVSGVLSVLLLQGCGGGGGVESTTTLTQAQAEALSDVLGDSFDSIDLSSSTKIGDIASRILAKFTPLFATQSSDFSASTACTGGGERSVAGTTTVNTSGSSFTATVNYTITLAGCMVPVEESDPFVADGAVTTRVTIRFNSSTNTGTFDLRFTGGVDVSGDAVTAGTCGINVSGNLAVADSMLSGTINGSICDTSISSTRTLSI